MFVLFFFVQLSILSFLEDEKAQVLYFPFRHMLNPFKLNKPKTATILFIIYTVLY